MGIRDAQYCFSEALRQVDFNNDPVMWNLLSGLVKLAQSLERDFQDLKSRR